jgi:hypothetical protein
MNTSTSTRKLQSATQFINLCLSNTCEWQTADADGHWFTVNAWTAAFWSAQGKAVRLA